jgi:hypothetical protein
MLDNTPDYRIAATADRLRRIIERSCVWPYDIVDIISAMEVFGVDFHDQRTHHLAPDQMYFLIRDVHNAAATDQAVFLSPEHKVCLEEAITRMHQ